LIDAPATQIAATIFWRRAAVPKIPLNTVSLENTVQQNQSPAVAIFRVAELNRTSLQSLNRNGKRGVNSLRENSAVN
jgi:hypothetical protein